MPEFRSHNRDLPSSALEALVRAHWKPLVRMVRSRLGNFDGRIGAEDVLQRVLLRALQGRTRPHALDQRALYAWALSMVRYEILHAIRDGRRCETMGDMRSDGSNPIDFHGASEVRESVDPLMPSLLELCCDLEDLPWEQRMLVVSRDFAGCGWETAAMLCDRPSLRSLRYMHHKGIHGLRAIREQRY
ncbi:MAG: DNA-directed RNA polymerase specialized sigma24 family protein, partial [Planctomycetota bacterium]